MIEFYADLHIHSVLSPCADLLMTRKNIFEKLIELGVNIFSITDHNSCKNSRYFNEEAKNNNMIFVPGIEIQSTEEIHILAYFKYMEDLEVVSSIIEKNLPLIKNKEEIYGYQLILDENDEFSEKEELFLASACSFGIEEIYSLVKENNGLVVPAHIDRSNSLISNFGYIPPNIDFDGFEVYNPNNISKLKEKYNFNSPIFSSSDAHFVHTIKKAKMIIELEDFNIDEVFISIKNKRIKIEVV